MNDCIFCAIAAGRAPARIVAETERTIAELGAAGVNLLQSSGAAAFQTVFHLHST